VEDKLQKLSVQHEELNEGKTKSLSELSAKSLELKKIIESRKSQLDPLLKTLHALKEKYQAVENRYNEQKQKYDSMMLKLDNERSGLQNETEKLEVRFLPLQPI